MLQLGHVKYANWEAKKGCGPAAQYSHARSHDRRGAGALQGGSESGRRYTLSLDSRQNRAGRKPRTKFLNGNLVGTQSLPSLTVNGSRISLDLGSQGIGGNSGTSYGDGYYELAVDTDVDGTFESVRHFYRLLRDATSDRLVLNQACSLSLAA